MIEKKFANWDYQAVQELESICRTLPVLPLGKVKAFFKQASDATQSDAKVIDRQSGNLFEGMTGFVGASDRKDFTATYDDGNPEILGHGVMVVETYDKSIGVTYCLARISETTFLTCGWIGEERRLSVKAVREMGLSEGELKESEVKGVTEQTTTADYSLVRVRGGVRGIWLREESSANNKHLMIALALEEGLPNEIGMAISAGKYRVVPNKHDTTGGCFVMLESWPAPGEPGFQKSLAASPQGALTATATTPTPTHTKGERYCLDCNIQITKDAEVCPSCKKALYVAGHPSWLAGLLGYLWGGLMGGLALGIVKAIELIGGFNNRTLEMVVFGIVAVGAWRTKKAKLVARRDLAVWKHDVSSKSNLVQDNGSSTESPLPVSVPTIIPDTTMVLASQGQRLGTMLLDTIFGFVSCFIIGLVLGLIGLGDLVQKLDSYLLGIVLVIYYYVPQEALSGRTLGKLITGTKVVKEDGTELSFVQALGRTLCRFIPFEAFSFFGGHGRPRGWHDKIPKTKVISVRRTREFAETKNNIEMPDVSSSGTWWKPLLIGGGVTLVVCIVALLALLQKPTVTYSSLKDLLRNVTKINLQKPTLIDQSVKDHLNATTKTNIEKPESSPSAVWKWILNRGGIRKTMELVESSNPDEPKRRVILNYPVKSDEVIAAFGKPKSKSRESFTRVPGEVGDAWHYEGVRLMEENGTIVEAHSNYEIEVKGSDSPVVAKAEQNQIVYLDDNAFARLTAGLFLASEIKTDTVSTMLQMVSFKVANNEQSGRLLNKYNVSAEQFSQEYNRRMFTKDNKLNQVLYNKVLAEMKTMTITK